MAIVEVRVDDRLIHGQVCGYWIPQFDVQRILIVDNEIVNDENRKVNLVLHQDVNCQFLIRRKLQRNCFVKSMKEFAL